jgi:hypothetical protein
MIAKMKRDRDDLNSQIQKINNDAAKKAEGDASKKRLLDAMGPVTIENAAERFKKIDDLSKKLMSKDFDIGSKLAAIRDKFEGIDFSLFKNKGKEEGINQTLSTLESIKALVGTIVDIGALSVKAKDSTKQMDSLQDSLNKFSTLVASITPTVEGNLKTNVEKLSVAADAIAKKESSISSLTNTLKAFAELSSVMKDLQKTSLSNEQRIGATTSVLGIITSANLISQDVATLKIDQGQNSKLSDVNKLFEGLSEASRGFSELQKSMTALAANNNVGLITKSISEFASIGEITEKLAGSNIKTALTVTRDIVKSVQELNDVLSSGDATKIKLTESLKKFVDNSGLGKNGSYKIENKGITMNVNFEIKINAADMEEALVLRHNSLIKDGIKGTLTEEENTKLTPYLR